jgi:hypothetical protein
MMKNAPIQQNGNLSALEKALSKKMKPMKPSSPRPGAQGDMKAALKKAAQ